MSEETQEKEVHPVSTEEKIRLNIKQSAKGAKYFDITVRGASIEEVESLYIKAEEFAYKSGCMRL